MGAGSTFPGNELVTLGLNRNASGATSYAAFCSATGKFGPGVPSAFTIPSERRFQTVSPLFGGTYVAKTWAKLRFSPMMTMTCLIGVVVASSRDGGVDWAKALPIASWKIAADTVVARAICRAV